MFLSFEEWKHRSLDYLRKQRFVEIRSIVQLQQLILFAYILESKVEISQS